MKKNRAQGQVTRESVEGRIQSVARRSRRVTRLAMVATAAGASYASTDVETAAYSLAVPVLPTAIALAERRASLKTIRSQITAYKNAQELSSTHPEYQLVITEDGASHVRDHAARQDIVIASSRRYQPIVLGQVLATHSSMVITTALTRAEELGPGVGTLAQGLGSVLVAGAVFAAYADGHQLRNGVYARQLDNIEGKAIQFNEPSGKPSA